MLRRTLVSIASLTSLSVVLALAVVGCGGTVSSEPPATAETATTRAPVAVSAHGPVKLFGEALGDVPLTTTQRAALEQMATDAETRHAQVRAARQELMTALAAQVEAGSIDRAALQPKLAAITAAMQASQPADRAAFEQLHAVLAPDQRAAFVDAVQVHAEQRKGAFMGKGGFKALAQELHLTDDQKAQIKAAVMQKRQAEGDQPGRELRGAKHQSESVMTAFKQDTFVLDQVSPAKDVGQQVSHMTDHILGIAEIAVPILTPAQRILAAQRLRERAAKVESSGDDQL